MIPDADNQFPENKTREVVADDWLNGKRMSNIIIFSGIKSHIYHS